MASDELDADLDLSFDAWVRFVFDHPATKPEWYWGTPDRWRDEPRLVLHHLSRLFEDPEFLLSAYTREQVGEGLWFLTSAICSEYMAFLHRSEIPWATRARTISSMNVLFERLFAKECGNALGHLDHVGNDALSSTCYMWWDIFPAQTDDMRLRDALLGVMSNCLSLPSEACRESALHGIGHQQFDWPEQVAAIIDDFLTEQTHITPDLRKYAMSARGGGVL